MSQQPSVAILSLACRYPDAADPAELWANVLEGRRSFRAVPPERLDLARYAAEVLGEADSITPIRAGLLTDWAFDRARFRISNDAFEATDLAHWLALELAAEAIDAIGGPEKLDRARTAVVVANTLTGEFSRASLLRLRAPFLDDLLADAAAAEGLAPEAGERLRRSFAAALRGRFPAPSEDSLAGGLANTIAGRIANHFDLKGGAYTVDGACASSLVAVADAGSLLATGQADAVVVGAVDLSLDPFELVGFSRNGALAEDEMRVFDARADGFWPGEGGAFALLMRQEDARQAALPPLALIRGWGLSTDGAGGLTRPSVEGQLLACRRACEGAGVDPADLALVEAHGTGTAVGDATELRALAALREGAKRPLPVGSIKANIGHAKAAAGLAGLIKAVEALRHGTVPPHVGCTVPHPAFAECGHRLRPALSPELLDGRAALAGVSSFGFGGINAHVVLETARPARSATALPPAPKAFDCELFAYAGVDAGDVVGQLEALESRAPSLSISEMADAAAEATARLQDKPLRVAIVAPDPGRLAERLARARTAVAAGEAVAEPQAGLCVGLAGTAPRIGFLFPGQAAPSRPGGGLWARCFDGAANLAGAVPLRPGASAAATEVAQPAIVAASLAGLALLQRLGVEAEVAVGHSLGEIAALAWAGALPSATALRLARRRGEVMARDCAAGGGMLRVAMPAAEAEAVAAAAGAVVACENAPAETVLAGPAEALDRLAALLAGRGVATDRLAVSHAFHSADMAPAAPAMAALLSELAWRRLAGTVVSTVTGAVIEEAAGLPELLSRQPTARVRFAAALAEAARRADLFVEVGPGQGLSRLARGRGFPSLPIDAFAASLAPLLACLGELHVRGCGLTLRALFDGRPIRPLPASAPVFIASPCGRRPSSGGALRLAVAQPREAAEPPVAPSGGRLAAVLAVVAEQTGLPKASLQPDDRFLDDLHLNSLAVTRIVAAAARSLRVRAPSAPAEFANATPRILADALQEVGDLEATPRAPARIAGVRPWVATYAMRWAPVAPDKARTHRVAWSTVALGGPVEAPALPPAPAGLLVRLAGPLTRHAAERLICLVAEAARAKVPHLAVVHEDAPVCGFARSLAREGSFATVRVVGGVGEDVSPGRLAAALDALLGRYSQVRLSRDGRLEAPVFAPCEPACDAAAAVTCDDVVLVVGGGRGIAAECALDLGRSTGAALILAGRSPPETAEVAETLARAERAGLRCLYVSADAADEEGLRSALAPAVAAFGAPTALIHAAAVNEPMRIAAVDADAARRSLVPKMDGLASAISACGPSLRRLVTFGSLIGRIGLEGEAHYALASAAQSAATAAWAGAGPRRAALALEWSVWGGVGMGERLGTTERLAASGVDPISVDDALGAFGRLLRSGACGTVAVTGRFGPPPDLVLGGPDLASLRFLDRPLVHFPGKEIVLETTLLRGRDPYLDDHVVDGRRILPGIIALEALAQAASALSELGPVTAIEDVAFERIVTADGASGAPIRLAALASEAGTEAAMFAADDDFAAPAVRARFMAAPEIGDDEAPPASPSQQDRGFAAEALYGPLFFAGARFRRVERIVEASSRRVTARLAAADAPPWFGPYEPQRLLLGDPAATDACIHVLQVAVPHRRVLPVAVARIAIARQGVPALVRAVERQARGGTYVFDIAVEDSAGRCIQRWQRAVFRAVGDLDVAAALTVEPGLAAPYLERAAREAFADDDIAVAFVSDGASAQDARRAAALLMLGLDGRVERRADGRPLRRDGGSISIAHRGGVTLAVAAGGEIGCDVETAGADPACRRFAASEACRKLGRRSPIPGERDIPFGRPVRIGDMKVLALHLPASPAPLTVAFSAIDKGALQ